MSERPSYIKEVPSEKKTLRRRVKEAVKKRSFFGGIEKIADRRRHAFNKRAHNARGLVLDLREQLDEARAKEVPEQRIEDLEQLLFLAEHKLKRMRRKRDFWRRRYVWAHERHRHWGVVLKHRRDRLRRWVARHRGFQPYMANGNPHKKLTAECKYAIYLMFRRGLYTTSTYEGYPGDGVHSTGSGHYVENQPDEKARCFDCGSGSFRKMVKAQNAEANRAGSYMVELIGPDNDRCYKNGARYTLTEGSALEEMHDNHIHTWLRDGAPQ